MEEIELLFKLETNKPKFKKLKIYKREIPTPKKKHNNRLPPPNISKPVSRRTKMPIIIARKKARLNKRKLANIFAKMTTFLGRGLERI